MLFNLATYPILYCEKMTKTVVVDFVAQKKVMQVSLEIKEDRNPLLDPEEEGPQKVTHDLWVALDFFNKKGDTVGVWEYGHSYPDLFVTHRFLRMLNAMPWISQPLIQEIGKASMHRPNRRVLRLLGQETYGHIMREVPENFLDALQLLNEKGVTFNVASVEDELRAGTISDSSELQALGIQSLETLRQEDAMAEQHMTC